MKFRAIILAAALAVTTAPFALSAEDAPPEMSDISCAGQSGYTYWFTADEFIESVSDAARLLKGIVVASLPRAGTLAFAGRPMMEGEAVTVATLDSLSYTPESAAPVNVSFTVLPVFDDGVGGNTATVTVTLTRHENRAPLAQNMEIRTYKNIAASGTFPATDPDGDPLTFRVTTKPKRGDMQILPDGSYVYTPYKNKTGSDVITYVAVDSFGNTSAQAKITVKIEKQSTKTSYADMAGNAAHYAALRLTEAKVFTGEQINGVYYFNPERTVSRAELIAMVMKVIGMNVPADVTATGFYDDADIPAWFRPYAQEALKAGIISGSESSDGRKYANANLPATFSEAVAVINNALRIANVNSSDGDEAVPVWAAQAVINMKAVGVMSGLPSSVGWYDEITRADAAIMLSNALDVYESSRPSGGLLSWVFGW